MENALIYEIAAIVFSALISFMLTPVVRVFAFKVKALDIPDSVRHFHLTVTPRLGGLAIFISFLCNVLLFCDLTPEITGLLLGTVVIVTVGVLDDILALSPWIKLLGQLLAAAIPVIYGVRIEFITLFGLDIEFGIFSIPITIGWIVLLTNSVNLIDGMDGLACGVSTISSFSILLCSLVLGQYDIAHLMAILAGSCLGFLPFNSHPARIFMGDTGALSLGYVFSVVSVMGLYKFSTSISFIIPILIFGLPFGDTFSAIFRRLKNKTGILQGDHEHFHHKLQGIGFSQKQSVIILYSISAILGISAVLFTMDLPLLALAVLLFSMLIGYINLLIFRSEDIVREQTGLALAYRRPPAQPPEKKPASKKEE